MEILRNNAYNNKVVLSSELKKWNKKRIENTGNCSREESLNGSTELKEYNSSSKISNNFQKKKKSNKHKHRTYVAIICQAICSGTKASNTVNMRTLSSVTQQASWNVWFQYSSTKKWARTGRREHQKKCSVKEEVHANSLTRALLLLREIEIGRDCFSLPVHEWNGIWV